MTDRSAAPKQPAADPLMVAKESFSTDVAGVPRTIPAGTLLPASDPLVNRFPGFFTLAYETATRSAGERRGAQP
jgi:hypothetical protein